MFTECTYPEVRDLRRVFGQLKTGTTRKEMSSVGGNS